MFPLHLELQALHEGLLLAVKFDLFPLEIDTDSIEVIHAINNGRATLTNLIESCRLLMHQKKGLLLRHSFRQGNAVADALAKDAKTKEKKCYKPGETKLFAEPPIFVKDLCDKDLCMDKYFVKQLSTSTC